jgi:putative ABC transport system permease protein
MRQLLTEGIILSLIGGVVGLLLAYSAVDLIVAFSPADLPRRNEIGIDSRILAFTFLISILSGIGFSLGAVFRMSKPDLIETLKAGSQRTTASGAQRRVGDLLVVGEIALSIVLVIGAGLLLNSFIRLQHVRLGFKPERVLTMQIPLPENKYLTGNSMADFHRRLMERIASLPGVESAALIGQLPLGGLDADFPSFDIEGRPKRDLNEKVEISGAVISADYFQVMGISLKAGRYFTDRDTENSASVVIINEAAARRYWSSDNPVGSRITALRTLSFEVVGIVENVKHQGLDQDDNPRLYLHYPQVPERVKPGFLRMCSLVIRSGASPEGLATAVATQVQTVDPEQPIAQVRTMSQVIATSIATQRFLVTLLSVFAAFALGLVAVGLYGVISYLVDRRTHEVGIRIALGAQRGVVLRMVIGQGIKLAIIGSIIGLIAASALTRLMKTLLFEVSTTDPMTFVATTLLLLSIALLACWIPARRATEVDPMIVLRSE